VPMLSRGFSEEWASHSHRMMSIYYVSRLHDNTSASTSEVAWHGTGFVHCLAMTPVPCMKTLWSHWTPSSAPLEGLDSDIA